MYLLNAMGFLFRMAWRDSRGSRSRLLLYLAAMVLGVAALVAINGFGDNLTRSIENEARALLGADLRIEHEEPLPPHIVSLIDSIGGTQARRTSFASMAYFPSANGTRLVTVRAIDGPYPFYGDAQTRPDSAYATYRARGGALVDGALLRQFNLTMGDSVRIGDRAYPIAGEVLKMPGQSAAFSTISPRVYVPQAGIDSTLFARGSRVERSILFKFNDGRDVQALVESIRPAFEKADVDLDTVAETSERWQEGLGNLYRFLSLVGFIALILGSLGVASAVHVYVQQRIETVAVLRCLGAAGRTTFGIYVLQAAALGLIGALAGCLVGVGVQVIVPWLLADFLPVAVNFAVSWEALVLGLSVGVSVTVLFALLPLLEVRDVSPMRALRSSVESGPPAWKDPWRVGIALAIASGVTGFAVLQAPTWEIGLGYAGGLFVVFGLLALTARGIAVGARYILSDAWSYPWRQGLANLYRPQNQTTLLMLALGLGTFLIMTLFLTQRTLLETIEVTGGSGQPNLVLFDVQTDQLAGVTSIVRNENLPVLQRVPIVTTQLQGVKGRSIEALEADSVDLTWAHRRDYRVTYRDHLSPSETLLKGSLADSVAGNPFRSGAAVPVSIEEEIAGELGVTLGDTLTFDVQGIPLATTVGSIRQVDWQRIGTNFFVVFPEGVLEQAPQMWVVLSRASTEEASGRVQAEVVQRYPNVSAIDLSLILSTFNALFERMAFVIRFMALFSILTGLLVLVGAVVVSRSQRAAESVLLKTLGASKRTVFQITTIEYLFLGTFAALTGIVLSLVAAWSLSLFVFEGPFVWAPAALAGALLAVVALTVGVGLTTSRGLYNRPPLEVLRAET
ncbi:ABC transporter permease [Salisaeta longa]|uniref:ABC transporter permease n=1 Tax=Salisaeta longa TaxID=503170 RepID=UPI0003B41834|nr:FtsX-like permease family protein [Salisaeta longa]